MPVTHSLLTLNYLYIGVLNLETNYLNQLQCLSHLKTFVLKSFPLSALFILPLLVLTSVSQLALT